MKPISLKPNSRIVSADRSSTRRLPISDRPRMIPGNSFPDWSDEGMFVSGTFPVQIFIGPLRWPSGRVVKSMNREFLPSRHKRERYC